MAHTIFSNVRKYLSHSVRATIYYRVDLAIALKKKREDEADKFIFLRNSHKSDNISLEKKKSILRFQGRVFNNVIKIDNGVGNFTVSCSEVRLPMLSTLQNLLSILQSSVQYQPTM
nr:hypothetical protein BgiMline_007096 [Biomphalaria glabrata]